MTPEKIEQERKAFEEWILNPVPPVPIDPCQKQKDGRYAYDHIEFAWRAWRARAAQSEWISVKDRLPEYKNDREQFLIMCQWKREPKTYFYKTSRLLKMLDHIYFDSEPCGADVIYWQPIPRVVELEANHERD